MIDKKEKQILWCLAYQSGPRGTCAGMANCFVKWDLEACVHACINKKGCIKNRLDLFH